MSRCSVTQNRATAWLHTLLWSPTTLAQTAQKRLQNAEVPLKSNSIFPVTFEFSACLVYLQKLFGNGDPPENSFVPKCDVGKGLRIRKRRRFGKKAFQETLSRFNVTTRKTSATVWTRRPEEKWLEPEVLWATPSQWTAWRSTSPLTLQCSLRLRSRIQRNRKWQNRLADRIVQKIETLGTPAIRTELRSE